MGGGHRIIPAAGGVQAETFGLGLGLGLGVRLGLGLSPLDTARTGRPRGGSLDRGRNSRSAPPRVSSHSGASFGCCRCWQGTAPRKGWPDTPVPPTSGWSDPRGRPRTRRPWHWRWCRSRRGRTPPRYRWRTAPGCMSRIRRLGSRRCWSPTREGTARSPRPSRRRSGLEGTGRTLPPMTHHRSRRRLACSGCRSL